MRGTVICHWTGLAILFAGGWMTRTVSCVEVSSNTAAAEHHCNSESRPASKQYCMQPPCTASCVYLRYQHLINWIRFFRFANLVDIRQNSLL